MQMTPYLNFDGTCREAMTFYADVFGGRTDILRFADSPAGGEVPPEARDRVMHARLDADGATLMASDVMPGMCMAEAGTCHVALMIEDVARAERVFSRLAERGKVTMPFAETFWVERFGMVVDRYGISWLVNGGKSRTPQEIAAEDLEGESS